MAMPSFGVSNGRDSNLLARSRMQCQYTKQRPRRIRVHGLCVLNQHAKAVKPRGSESGVMGSSPEGLTTHAQEPVDPPHFPSVKLPKATPRSKAPASWRDILHPTPDRVGPWAITTCLGAGCATSDVMVTAGINLVGFLDSKGSPRGYRVRRGLRAHLPGTSSRSS